MIEKEIISISNDGISSVSAKDRLENLFKNTENSYIKKFLH